MPRARGVFPTLVGVFLVNRLVSQVVSRLPHARGGVSVGTPDGVRVVVSSPRSWGCFFFARGRILALPVFPTLVGVFPARKPWAMPVSSLPHARGGVSELRRQAQIEAGSSPRSWGCFQVVEPVKGLFHVFPTLVGVFPSYPAISVPPRRLPHARGGVSSRPLRRRPRSSSSPRSWGCFRICACCGWLKNVFPTLVGVFLMTCRFLTDAERLPHARGGVSPAGTPSMAPPRSSPRSWGCFYLQHIRKHTKKVFPTLVGVFPPAWHGDCTDGGLPHARGGVSLPAPRMTQRRKSSPRSWGCCQDSLLHGGLSVRSGSYSMSCVLIQKR